MNAGTISTVMRKEVMVAAQKYGGVTFGDFVVEVKILLVGSWFS